MQRHKSQNVTFIPITNPTQSATFCAKMYLYHLTYVEQLYRIVTLL